MGRSSDMPWSNVRHWSGNIPVKILSSTWQAALPALFIVSCALETHWHMPCELWWCLYTNQWNPFRFPPTFLWGVLVPLWRDSCGKLKNLAPLIKSESNRSSSSAELYVMIVSLEWNPFICSAHSFSIKDDQLNQVVRVILTVSNLVCVSRQLAQFVYSKPLVYVYIMYI
jgi:hypothetical protein